ncbi:MAG: hypothetical protein AAFV01_13420, partial [Bacteroidota bacterium]
MRMGPAAPVRATYEGYNSLNGIDPHNFRVVTEFFDFHVPIRPGRAFEIPMPVSFDATVLDGRCDASRLTKPEQKAAVLALQIRDRLACDADPDGAKPHPLPVLPDRYEVRTEVNYVDSGLGKNFTSYRHEWWDGLNNREATTVYSPDYQHRIELGDAGIAVTYDRDGYCVVEPRGELEPGSGPHIVDKRTGNPQTSNTYLGSRPGDTYCGQGEARGMPTDTFVRTDTAAGANDTDLRVDVIFEYSRPGWDLRMGIAPVRVSYLGYNSIGFDPHNVEVTVDYYDFHEPANMDRPFQLPMPVSFDANNLVGRCDASSLNTPSQRAAALALPVRDRYVCDAGADDVKAHPLPVLPDQYSVRTEVNYVESGLGNNFSSYRHQWWDGLNNREATTVYAPDYQHRIELGDVGVAITFDLNGNCVAEMMGEPQAGSGPHIINRRTNQFQTSNT